MANTRITSSFITREFLSVLHSALAIVKNVDHSWNKFFGNSIGPVGKGGQTINIRKPVLGTVRRTWTMDQGDVTETSVPLTANQIFGVDLNFSDADLALTIEDFSERYIMPNALLLASNIDAYVAGVMKNAFFNSAGTPATSPNDVAFFLDAKRKLHENLIPAGERLITVIGPQTEATMVKALAGQYNPQPWISSMFEKGQMPSSNALGLEWYMSQILSAHACGSRVATGETQTSGANQTGSSITVGSISKTIKKGDILTVADCYNVNFETKQSTGQLKEFTVTSDVSSPYTSIPISPAIVASGTNQNVSAAVGTTKAVSFIGVASTTYKNDLVFSPKSTAVAFVDLELPLGMDMAERVTGDGVSIRFLRGYDIVNARQLSRMDVLMGLAVVRPEWGARVYGASA